MNWVTDYELGCRVVKFRTKDGRDISLHMDIGSGSTNSSPFYASSFSKNEWREVVEKLVDIKSHDDTISKS